MHGYEGGGHDPLVHKFHRIPQEITVPENDMDLYVILSNKFTIVLKNCTEGSLEVRDMNRDVNPPAGTGIAFVR
jgi:hypothetical protein